MHHHPTTRPLQYGSVCLQAAWFSEIEPFPCAVLAHRYPAVPNLGDMTAIASQIRAGHVAAPDILCGQYASPDVQHRRRAPGPGHPARRTHPQLCGARKCHRPNPPRKPSTARHTRLGKRPRRVQRPFKRLWLPAGRTGRRKPCARTARGQMGARRSRVWTPPPHCVAGARCPTFRRRPTPPRVSCGKWSRRPQSL
jgi:hypothetical protein